MYICPEIWERIKVHVWGPAQSIKEPRLALDPMGVCSSVPRVPRYIFCSFAKIQFYIVDFFRWAICLLLGFIWSQIKYKLVFGCSSKNRYSSNLRIKTQIALTKLDVCLIQTEILSSILKNKDPPVKNCSSHSIALEWKSHDIVSKFHSHIITCEWNSLITSGE